MTSTISVPYDQFLSGKRASHVPVGFEMHRSSTPYLFPFQRAIVEWACRQGRCAIFADTGLGKTRMQLEWANQTAMYTGRDVLILAPLAVASQTVREADSMGIAITHDRDGSARANGITITNYERLHLFDPYRFGAIVLDESSILKAFDGKTRHAIQEFASVIDYHLACTATPAPNDHMELGTHAEFVGVGTRAEMLAEYFCHDGGETQKWRLKGHAVSDFWRWVASWAVSVKMPSDLGFPDEGYLLPNLSIVEHPIDVQISAGSTTLFGQSAATLNDQRIARRESIGARVDACAQLVADHPDESWVIWCDLNDEANALARSIPGARQISGADTAETKESILEWFAASSDDPRVLVTKPSICGFGLNWQHCANVAFVGVSHSYESFYQAVRRCWRFGQTRPVTAHVFFSDAEGGIVRNLKRKEADAEVMSREMVSAMSQFGGVMIRPHAELASGTIESGKSWELHNADCVEMMRALASDSLDYSIFSPPFASLYTYSDSERDMGNCRSDAEFAAHFAYAVRELYRAMKPGRLVSFHCMNLPTSKERDGYIGIRDFRGELIRLFESEGFIYHSEVTIWKDPVTAMQRTKALGLLHKTIRKDSSMSRQGIPDYLVTMRKPGDNPDPISHTHDDFPVSLWQRYASPVWMDINPSRTLQHESARDHADERHICPLQLDVIERAIFLWTNPGDLVFSPFAGIGSEGHVAINMGRRFLGVELKPSYFRQAVRNLCAAQTQSTQMRIFDDTDIDGQLEAHR